MLKFDFSTVECFDLDDKPIADPAHKGLAMLIFRMAQNLDLVEKSREINKGREVELEKTELAEVKRLLQGDRLFSFVRKALLDYIEEVEHKAKEQKN